MNGGDLHGMTYHCHCLIEFISEKLGSEVKPFPRMGLLILICYILILILLRKYKNHQTLKQVFYMKPYIHVRYLAQVFLECEIFLTKAVGKIKTHFMFNNFLSKIMPFMRKCRKMLYSWKGHKCQYNTARAL